MGDHKRMNNSAERDLVMSQAAFVHPLSRLRKGPKNWIQIRIRKILLTVVSSSARLRITKKNTKKKSSRVWRLWSAALLMIEVSFPSQSCQGSEAERNSMRTDMSYRLACLNVRILLGWVCIWWHLLGSG